MHPVSAVLTTVAICFVALQWRASAEVVVGWFLLLFFVSVLGFCLLGCGFAINEGIWGEMPLADVQLGCSG